MKVTYNESLDGAWKFYTRTRTIPLGDDPYGTALRYKTGFPARRTVLGLAKPNLDCLPESYQYFIESNVDVYIIPVDDYTGNFHGFIFKAVNSKVFRSLDGVKGMFYGFHEFKGFKKNMKIILAEGIKDREAISLCGYPYTLAMLRDSLSTKQWDVLKRLTKNIILICDRDWQGKRQGRAMKWYKGIEYVLSPTKDPGVVWDYGGNALFTKNWLKGYLRSIVPNRT